MSKLITDQQLLAKYGKPGDESNLINIKLPYHMRLAWSPATYVTTMRCHRLVSANFTAVFMEIFDRYGSKRISELGIDLFGGCYNNRMMRGSKSKPSRHSWAVAIDLDPDRNGLRVQAPKAQFSKPEYKLMIDIFYKYGFNSLGREENRDWMHFEIAS